VKKKASGIIPLPCVRRLKILQEQKEGKPPEGKHDLEIKNLFSL